ncbi:hypothetical protein DFP73DRAFT_524589 [Morchella snyderi]|nr:hypothetical protein DFP73DRAFT_524589 [Morchella snyderi]
MNAATTVVVGMYVVVDDRASASSATLQSYIRDIKAGDENPEKKINTIDVNLLVEMKVTKGVILGSVLQVLKSGEQKAILKKMMVYPKWQKRQNKLVWGHHFVGARFSQEKGELIFKILTAIGSGYHLGVERSVEKEVPNCDFEPEDVRGVWVRRTRGESYWNKLNTPKSVSRQNKG